MNIRGERAVDEIASRLASRWLWAVDLKLGAQTMASVTKTARCANSTCRAPLAQNHAGPCPACGNEGTEIAVVASESIDISDSVRWQTRSEYYRKNPKVRAVVIAITVFGPLIGLFLVGWLGVVAALVLGGITYKGRAKARFQTAVLLSHVHFVHRLAVCLYNAAASHIAQQTGQKIRARMRYRRVIGALS